MIFFNCPNYLVFFIILLMKIILPVFEIKIKFYRKKSKTGNFYS